MKQNIFLIGFMGSGKSHWGQIWAQKNGYTFYDLDAEIEKSAKLNVEQIFEKQGEDEFRELERTHLKKFQNKKKFLLACGGGTPCFFDNLLWMKQHGQIIYLKATPKYILDRVMDETSKRPLLKEVNTSELLFFIQKTLKEREPYYLKAHHIIEVNTLNDDSLKRILEKDSEKKINEFHQKNNDENLHENEKEAIASSANNEISTQLKSKKAHHA